MSRWFVKLSGGGTAPTLAWAGACVGGAEAEWVLCSIALKIALL